jgi:Flp pilus assembly protein CpaB
VRSLLHGTLRALSVPGTPDELLSGTLHDGDHVDVIANLKTGDCTTCFATRNIARDVLVLRAAGTSAVSAAKPGDQSSSVLLAVHDSREAQKIWYAVENSAGWSLALRPVANASDSPEDVEGITSLLTDGASNANAGHYVGSGK